MQHFDRVIVADWSAASARSPARPSADAIWLGSQDANGASSSYHRSRASAETALSQAIDTALARGESLLIGCDFPMGYPTGFAARLTGTATARAVWAWLAAHIEDGPDNRNNRFQVAAQINPHFRHGGLHRPVLGPPRHAEPPRPYPAAKPSTTAP